MLNTFTYFERNVHANRCNMKNKKILGAVVIVNSVMESNSFELHYVLRSYNILGAVLLLLCSLCQSCFQHGPVMGTEIF